MFVSLIFLNLFLLFFFPPFILFENSHQLYLEIVLLPSLFSFMGLQLCNEVKIVDIDLYLLSSLF